MGDKSDRLPTKKASSADIQRFLDEIAAMPVGTTEGGRGRLIFALDATASRQPTWDQAARIQAEMFVETTKLGGLEIQLCFFRGFGEFKVSPWLTRSEDLSRMMTSVFCRAGATQICKVLRYAINESKARRVNALVYVGDCIEEDVDSLGVLAGELGVLGIPAFMFHEGNDPVAGHAFLQIARLTNGAYCRFDLGSAAILKDLLMAVAVFAAGGQTALDDLANRSGREIKQIADQRKGR